MKALLLIGLAPLLLSEPAAAQSHPDMPGMAMPAQTPAPPATDRKQAAPPEQPMTDMPGMDMSTPQQDPHAGHTMTATAAPESPGSGTDLPPGSAPAPAVQHDRAADRFYDKRAMDKAEGQLLAEHGGMTYHQLLFNLAEYQVRDGRDGYRWDGEFWIGGDINRFTLKSEGEGNWRDRVESAEIQALYSRAIDPYWNLQLGVRQDVQPGPDRTYAVVGVEGLAPYWIEFEGALFLSDKGDLLGRVEAYYDQRITENLVLQPRVELNGAAQDVPANAIGSGLSQAELGLRLRYEKVREFAPYMGISWDRKLGHTADFARLRGEGTGGVSLVVGIRTWF